MNGAEALDVRAGDFIKKSRRAHEGEGVRKKRDFNSRRSGEADDKSVRSGDYRRATQALLKVDAKASLEGVEDAIKESPPTRSLGDLTEERRESLLSYVERQGLRGCSFLSQSTALKEQINPPKAVCPHIYSSAYNVSLNIKHSRHSNFEHSNFVIFI